MESILNHLHAAYSPRALILYGSYADGSENENSDFDALILAEHVPCHDVSAVGDIRLDVWVYPPEHFTEEDTLEEIIQIMDGVIVHDPDGIGAALQARVRAYADAKPLPTDAENAETVAWCRKMLVRTARTDAEGLYRWHWLLTDSLEIACNLLHQPYRGPQKSLRWLKQNHPDVYAAYSRALGEFTKDALAAWIDCMEGLL